MLADMKNTSLTRSVPFWLLLAVSVIAIGIGGWLVWDNANTMHSTLLDGTATNVEVYVGQAWITAGAAVLAAGLIGILLTLAIAAVRSGAPVRREPETPTTVIETIEDEADDLSPDTETSDEDLSEADRSDQNGSSGSTAIATKISVK